MTKKIAWCKGLKVTTAKGVTELKKGGMPALWEFLKWDIVNDPQAKECADIITRELWCIGFIDLSCLTRDNSTFTVEVIPVD